MFDLDVGKLIVIGIVALIAIPSKDLPRVLRQLGQLAGRTRRMAAEFQAQFAEAMREAELDEIRKDIKGEMAEIRDGMRLDRSFDPVGDARRHISGAVAALQSDREPSGSHEESEPEGSQPKNEQHKDTDA